MTIWQRESNYTYQNIPHVTIISFICSVSWLLQSNNPSWYINKPLPVNCHLESILCIIATLQDAPGSLKWHWHVTEGMTENPDLENLILMSSFTIILEKGKKKITPIHSYFLLAKPDNHGIAQQIPLCSAGIPDSGQRDGILLIWKDYFKSLSVYILQCKVLAQLTWEDTGVSNIYQRNFQLPSKLQFKSQQLVHEWAGPNTPHYSTLLGHLGQSGKKFQLPSCCSFSVIVQCVNPTTFYGPLRTGFLLELVFLFVYFYETVSRLPQLKLQYIILPSFKKKLILAIFFYWNLMSPSVGDHSHDVT